MKLCSIIKRRKFQSTLLNESSKMRLFLKSFNQENSLIYSLKWDIQKFIGFFGTNDINNQVKFSIYSNEIKIHNFNLSKNKTILKLYKHHAFLPINNMMQCTQFIKFMKSTDPFNSMHSVLQGNIIFRSYSKQSLPNYKILLHRIIKHVHPDYFSDFPNEQKVNTTSLQCLNEWLNEFEKFDLNSSTSRSSIQRVGRRFQIIFYYKKLLESSCSDKTNIKYELDSNNSQNLNGKKNESISKITDTLYGPVGTYGVKEKQRILCNGLIKLMKNMKIEIPEEFKLFVGPKQREPDSFFNPNDTNISQKSYYSEEGVDSIFEFLNSIPVQDLHAAVIAKDEQLMARVDVDMFRNRIGEFIGASGIFMRAYGTRSNEQLELIHTFLKTLENNFPGLDTRYWNRKQVRQTSVYAANEERATSFYGSSRHDSLINKLQGMTLFIDEGHCRVEDDGSIVLGASDDTEYWLQFLEHGFDPEESIMKRQFMSMVHELEKKASYRLNISLIIAESEELALTTNYARFLEDLIYFDALEEHKKNPSQITNLLIEPRYKEFFEGVYIVVRDPQNAIESEEKISEEKEAIRVHPQYGFIEVTMNTNPLEIYYAVESMGVYARFVSEKNQREAKLINHETNKVRRRLQLHTVQAANNLSTEQVIECCKRLLSIGGDLVPSLKGKNLIISDGFKFHQNAIEIQWNFQK